MNKQFSHKTQQLGLYLLLFFCLYVVAILSSIVPNPLKKDEVYRRYVPSVDEGPTYIERYRDGERASFELRDYNKEQEELIERLHEGRQRRDYSPYNQYDEEINSLRNDLEELRHELKKRDDHYPYNQN